VQLARWLIDTDQARARDMAFDREGRVTDFGVGGPALEKAIASGRPFMTSGCPGASGEVACNRPFGNEKPGPDLRNYPFEPQAPDLELIRGQLWSHE
jgi:biotin synthase